MCCNRVLSVNIAEFSTIQVVCQAIIYNNSCVYCLLFSLLSLILNTLIYSLAFIIILFLLFRTYYNRFKELLVQYQYVIKVIININIVLSSTMLRLFVFYKTAYIISKNFLLFTSPVITSSQYIKLLYYFILYITIIGKVALFAISITSYLGLIQLTSFALLLILPIKSSVNI